jgi:hypothetical protein
MIKPSSAQTQTTRCTPKISYEQIGIEIRHAASVSERFWSGNDFEGAFAACFGGAFLSFKNSVGC